MVKQKNITTTAKHIAVFGAGRTGSAIAQQLASDGFCVDLLDTQPKNISPRQNLHVHQVTTDSVQTQLQLQAILKKHGIAEFDSIFHTFLYSKRDFELFMHITGDYAQHFGTIGTILTFDRQVDQGVLDENSPKIDLEHIGINGGYTQGKRELEIAIEEYKINHPSIKFFLPKTFHIIGTGWVPGICPPYFRDLNLLQALETRSIALPYAGDILYQAIDGNDLAKYIALGLEKKLDGDFIIINPEIITAKEYYHTLAELNGTELEILDFPIESVCDTQIMLLDWVCSTDRLSQALGMTLDCIPYEQSLKISLEYLKNQRSDIWQKMNRGDAPQIKTMSKKIKNVRKILKQNKRKKTLDSAFVALTTHAKNGSFSAQKIIKHLKQNKNISPILAQIKTTIKTNQTLYQLKNNNITNKLANAVLSRRKAGFETILEYNPDIVIDLGCGPNTFILDLMERLISQNPQMIGIGIDLRENIEIAQTIMETIFPNYKKSIHLQALNITNPRATRAMFKILIDNLTKHNKTGKLVIYNQGLFRYLSAEKQSQLAKTMYQIACMWPDEIAWVQGDNETRANQDVSKVNGTDANIWETEEGMFAMFEDAGWRVDYGIYDQSKIMVLRP